MKGKTKQERQEMLDYLLQKQLKELKKICFKYQHRPLLLNSVKIQESSNLNKDVVGLHEGINIKNECDFTHLITISSYLLDMYLNYKYNKKYNKKVLENVIKHEILHGFVYEQYEHFIDINGIDMDASPIFLAVLEFFNVSSGHHAADIFEKTEIYKRVKEIKNFKELNKYLMNLLIRYENITGKLKIIKYGNGKNVNLIGNYFSFDEESCGLIKDETSIVYAHYRNLNTNFRTNFFRIGATIPPEKIESLVKKKMVSDNFIVTKKEIWHVINKDKTIKIAC